ncbi:hypothetical protein GCM10027299_46780 [Larkinella ripae]
MASLLMAGPDDETKKSRRTKERVERREYRNSIEEITYHDRHQKVATVRTFDKNNRKLSEEHYRDFQLRIRHGQTRSWYPNGQVHWTCDYKENQINGPFFSYYSDGTLKRRELYRLGQVRKGGQCFTPEGDPTSCQPLVQNAEFDGGSRKFTQFLKERLGRVKSTEPTVFITLEGTVSEDGFLFNLRPLPYLRHRPESERELANLLISALRETPRWRPLIVDDQTTQSELLISVQVRVGHVFSANYGYNTL